jgi:hypothetical protein
MTSLPFTHSHIAHPCPYCMPIALSIELKNHLQVASQFVERFHKGKGKFEYKIGSEKE